MEAAKSTRIGGKLAAAAVVAVLIAGPVSADAKTVYPYAQAMSSSQGAAVNGSIPQSIDTGRKVH